MPVLSLRFYAFSFFLLFLLVPPTLSADHYVAKVYCAIFGNNDAAKEYQAIVHEALQAFGVTDFKGVPVKKMAAISQKVLGDGTVSFTMQGIWINEDLLMEYPFEEVVFTLYHEAANYAFRHHAKEILLLLPASLLFYSIPHLSVHMIDQQYRWTRVGYIGAASMLMIGLLNRLLMRPIVRSLERKAEQEAARVLCRSGKTFIVQAHINYLRSLFDEGEKATATWWDSLSDRINYVTACLQEFATA